MASFLAACSCLAHLCTALSLYSVSVVLAASSFIIIFIENTNYEEWVVQAALHKKWREALAHDHIGIRPGTEKLKNFPELPPEVAQGVVTDLHKEFQLISKDVISSNLVT